MSTEEEFHILHLSDFTLKDIFYALTKCGKVQNKQRCFCFHLVGWIRYVCNVNFI